MSLEDILMTLESLKGGVRQRYKADIRGVFGSYVRGHHTVNSDLDVLVEYDKGATLIDHVGLSLFLEEHLGMSVDVVIESAIREEIREEILREKVSV
ncbi:nucleotidyltransferase family protein [Candidatus Magnetobacterium casense]|uniref:Nucleotidyltransferase domain-containing protein n=1 Tax=Candidatus Magnetobacterium casense TaxID=1455061 RepID=A0ABS6RV56_9BACT|nr:nucleotidyltransferase domain-containing protein [Candidatus Magnetobacterium casensis]MBV6340327.1 nucleotidyltransferase domain-containing protein [Candidatus Magnetobacterium casensis]